MFLTSIDPFGRGTWAAGRRPMPMDVIRGKDDVTLRFDLPGIDPETLEVTVDRGLLTVSARRSEEYTEGENPTFRERVMGSFTRRLRLSDAVDADKIDANYENGVLTVRLPLVEKAAPRKIEVRHDADKAIAA